MENKIITAKEAYELAIGYKSDKVKELTLKCDEEIKVKAKQGHVKESVWCNTFTKEVVETVAKKFHELGFEVRIGQNGWLYFSWENVE